MSYRFFSGFSGASRALLYAVVPMALFSAVGSFMIFSKGAEANPLGNLFFIGALDFLIGGAVTGLFLGLIGGLKKDDEYLVGRICAFIHGMIVLLSLCAMVLLIPRIFSAA
jgi:hypothetical protein